MTIIQSVGLKMAVQVIVITRIFKLTHHILSEITMIGSRSTNQMKAFLSVLLVIDSNLVVCTYFRIKEGGNFFNVLAQARALCAS